MFAAPNMIQTMGKASVKVGSSGASFSGFTTSGSWTQPIGPNDNFVLAGININSSSAPGNVTLGGVSMNVIDDAFYTGGFFHGLYYLFNPPVGSKTVQVVDSSGGYLAGGSASFSGVGTFGVAGGGSGGSTTNYFNNTGATSGVSTSGITPGPLNSTRGLWVVSMGADSTGAFTTSGTALSSRSYSIGNNYPWMMASYLSNSTSLVWSAPSSTCNEIGTLLLP